jgi:hypothetical protein
VTAGPSTGGRWRIFPRLGETATTDEILAALDAPEALARRR